MARRHDKRDDLRIASRVGSISVPACTKQACARPDAHPVVPRETLPFPPRGDRHSPLITTPRSRSPALPGTGQPSPDRVSPRCEPRRGPVQRPNSEWLTDRTSPAVCARLRVVPRPTWPRARYSVTRPLQGPHCCVVVAASITARPMPPERTMPVAAATASKCSILHQTDILLPKSCLPSRAVPSPSCPAAARPGDPESARSSFQPLLLSVARPVSERSGTTTAGGVSLIMLKRSSSVKPYVS